MLTVLFATHNGARTLPRMLEAMTALEAPAGGWKLVAVDNASSDDSVSLVRAFSDRLPLTLVHEPRRGKNRALNTGLDHVEGDLVVLTDDDVLPRKDWLCQLRRAADARSDFSVFGGTILPFWLTEPKDWIIRLVPPATFGLTDPSHQEGPISPGLVWGGNMAVRSVVFGAGHRFDESIGPDGTNYAMGSEVELTARLEGKGFQCWFCKDAVVRHIIREHQLEKSWLKGRAFRYGRGTFRQQLRAQPSITELPRLFGMPRWMVRSLVGHAAELGVAILTADRDRTFTAQWDLHFCLGYLAESRNVRGGSGGN